MSASSTAQVLTPLVFRIVLLCAQQGSSCTGDSRELQRPEILHSCFTVHKIGQTSVFMEMFSFFTVRKIFPATHRTFLCSCMHSPFPVCARCPQAATEGCYSSQAAELLLPSFRPVRFSTP